MARLGGNGVCCYGGHLLKLALLRAAALISPQDQLSPGSVDLTMHRDCPLDCKVYVGNLGNNGNKTELERAFGYYGPLRSVWVARNPPGFAFVEFEDPRDANDAVRELDGRTLCGSRVRVELSSGEKRSRNRGPPPSWNRRPRDDRRRSPVTRRRQLVLFQHHDQRAQISLAGVVSHDPGLASRQISTQEKHQPEQKQVPFQRQKTGEIALQRQEPQTFQILL
ncbi:Serine/arginine-rich splicing factor 3 [Merluccius polli]|uniref:Serine/arginine-rich splicing factor 3 n=1 Tax=Merluccius polli TaxID=89951 RepID=A0AA47MD14_MERPO|nr:Serine/arginine-rich splicing factor 3 [Merluccius polli]